MVREVGSMKGTDGLLEGMVSDAWVDDESDGLL